MATRLREAGGAEFKVIDAFLKGTTSPDSPEVNRVGAAFQCVILAPLIVGGRGIAERLISQQGQYANDAYSAVAAAPLVAALMAEVELAVMLAAAVILAVVAVSPGKIPCFQRSIFMCIEKA